MGLKRDKEEEEDGENFRERRLLISTDFIFLGAVVICVPEFLTMCHQQKLTLFV